MGKNSPPNLQYYLTIRQAADMIGVSTSTLRAWDRAGKLKAARNPMNRYRLYCKEDIEALLARIQKTATASPPEAQTRRGGER
jgi:excisionase family DNA binding protein